MTNRGDDILIIDYVAGDENAMRILIERWEGPVYAFLARMLGSAAEAEDVCQEIFIKLIKTAGQYRPEDKFQSWLFRIAGNQARSRLRRRKILRWLPLTNEYDTTPAPGVNTLDKLASQEEKIRVQAAIARLADRQRQALVLKAYHELSYREIADTMETSIESVQMLLHRARTALRNDLSSREDQT